MDNNNKCKKKKVSFPRWLKKICYEEQKDSRYFQYIDKSLERKAIAFTLKGLYL